MKEHKALSNQLVYWVPVVWELVMIMVNSCYVFTHPILTSGANKHWSSVPCSMTLSCWGIQSCRSWLNDMNKIEWELKLQAWWLGSVSVMRSCFDALFVCTVDEAVKCHFLLACILLLVGGFMFGFCHINHQVMKHVMSCTDWTT